MVFVVSIIPGPITKADPLSLGRSKALMISIDSISFSCAGMVMKSGANAATVSLMFVGVIMKTKSAPVRKAPKHTP